MADDIITIQGLGELKRDVRFKDWFLGEDIKVSLFDAKPMPVRVVIENAQDSSLIIMIEQAVESFLRLDSHYRDHIAELLYDTYKTAVEAGADPLEIRNSSDAWGHIHPKRIEISQRRRDKEIYVNVACECDWEEEHGLQLVFKRGEKITRVSEQDGHLTTSDAFDTPDSEDALLSAF
jgi:hypothetical protein